MGILSSLYQKFEQSQIPIVPPITPQEQGGQIVPAPNNQPAGIKTIAELEAELVKTSPNALANQSTGLQVAQTREISRQNLPKVNWKRRIITTGAVIVIPLTIVTVANLPVAFIRRSVAQSLPVLLIPSYVAMEENFKKGVTSLEAARQLIDSPTSALDIDRGRERLKEATEQINSIPAWFLDDWDNYYKHYSWYRAYDWRFSPSGMQKARADIGALEAKVFQETNAQKLLTDAELAISHAKQQYQQAQSDTDRKQAIDLWRAGLDQLAQVPSTSLAGQQVQQKLAASTRDFEQVVGIVAGNQKTIAYFTIAREYAKRAAEQGRNPPHSARRWQEIIIFWETAIAELQKVPESDLAGYTQAQQLTAEYRRQLSEVRIRLDSETESVTNFQTAQQQIITLQQDANQLQPNQVIGRVEQIMTKLDRVQNGTTVYLEAQRLKLSANNFLKKLK